MGKKKKEKFVRLVRSLANEHGLRIGFLVISDGSSTYGFTTYRDSKDAIGGISVLKDLLEQIEGDSE